MGKLAFLFPGQGSQAVGMGHALAETYPQARTLFQDVDRLIGWPLTDVMFKGPEEELLQTVNTQPALFAVSVAAYNVLISETAFRPDFVAGHSIGEYAALYASGVFSLETGLRLVSRRAQAMQEAAARAGGAMAAILGLPADVVKQLCAEAEKSGAGIVDPANYNSPGQVVISGEVGAVGAASELAKAHGAKKVMPLKVAGAFHSRLMAPAASAMVEVLADASLSAPSIPLVANVTADFTEDVETMRRNLAVQIDGPVRWEETLFKLQAQGCDRFIEVGSGSVLSGLVKRTLQDVSFASFGSPADLEKVLKLGDYE